MSISLLQFTQGIQGYKLHRYECRGDAVIVHISKHKNKFSCVACRSFNVTPTPVSERAIKALSIGSKQTIFNIKMHRLRCHDCCAYRMEGIHFTSSSSSRISKRLERTVLDLRKHMSIKAVADYLDLNWDTVKNIEKKYLGKKYKHISLKKVHSIGIDEIYMGKKLGEKGYFTIVKDLNSGAVLHVGKGKKGACLDEFAARIKSSRAKIKYVAVDLAPSFTSWIKLNFPDATIVYDHFHVIKLMNDKVNNIRRRLMRDLEDEDKSDLKGQRWNFNINNENLGDAARDQLDKCCFLYEELGKAYALKEGLRRIYRIKDIDLAQNALVYWCELAEASKIREMITMAKTIRKHGAGIIAYWETGITSAAMEGFNNKIGWLTRQAYGYRDEQYLILKIFDLPNLKVTKEL